MKILVTGGGGREHAIIKKLSERGSHTLFCAPGNGGITAEAECYPDIKATDISGQTELAKRLVADLVVVGPDDSLALGLADSLRAEGIPAFGPGKSAARLESSKVFSKNLMKKYGIPTAGYEVFDNPTAAKAYIETLESFPTVIKADGLALGKGVIIAEDKQSALNAVSEMMEDKKFGESGSQIVVEEFLTGPEISVFVVTDGKSAVELSSAMDHKRAGDNDTGLNTGGMGTVAPNPYYTESIAEETRERIIIPTIKAMNDEGCPFSGVIFFGLMATPNGVKVIEYNSRFGDPEAQVILPLFDGDFDKLLLKTAKGSLDAYITAVQADDKRRDDPDYPGALGFTFDSVNMRGDIHYAVAKTSKHAACVVLASGGYPEKYETGKVITGLTDKGQADMGQFAGDVAITGRIYIDHAGTKLSDGQFLTAGGRVLGVVAEAETLEAAIKSAYAAADGIDFDKKHFRKDIGKRALEA
jgi:phosphoribosylamine--glycine ligase